MQFQRSFPIVILNDRRLVYPAIIRCLPGVLTISEGINEFLFIKIITGIFIRYQNRVSVNLFFRIVYVYYTVISYEYVIDIISFMLYFPAQIKAADISLRP